MACGQSVTKCLCGVIFFTDLKSKVLSYFRLCAGTHNEVLLLKRIFDKGAKFDILKFDIHVIASALKLYLRELPDPLIPAVYYDRYLKVRSNMNDKIIEYSRATCTTRRLIY